MKMRSKIVTCLVLALSISCLATGCKKKAQETETSSETIRVTEKKTDSEKAKKATTTSTTLKSNDGSISKTLPEDNSSIVDTTFCIPEAAFNSSVPLEIFLLYCPNISDMCMVSPHLIQTSSIVKFFLRSEAISNSVVHIP